MFYPKALVRIVSLLICSAVSALVVPVTSFGQHAFVATMKVNNNVARDIVNAPENDKQPLFDPLIASAFVQDTIAINYNTN